MYIVFDKKKHKWIKGVKINQEGELYKGLIRLNADRYVIYKDTGLCDRENNCIYEGNILQIDDNSNIFEGSVYYHEKLARFVVLNWNTDKYYSLVDTIADHSIIVGHLAK